MLDGLVSEAQMHRLFRVTSGEAGWTRAREDMAEREVDAEIARAFRGRVAGDADLLDRLRALAAAWPAGEVPVPMRQTRDRLVAELRGLLAKDCSRALEPDLIVLDEFQRDRKSVV